MEQWGRTLGPDTSSTKSLPWIAALTMTRYAETSTFIWYPVGGGKEGSQKYTQQVGCIGTCTLFTNNITRQRFGQSLSLVVVVR